MSFDTQVEAAAKVLQAKARCEKGRKLDDIEARLMALSMFATAEAVKEDVFTEDYVKTLDALSI